MEASYRIRTVHPEDLNQVARIEELCFPAAEAASKESFRQRIETFPESFLVAETEEGIIGFINGCVTNGRTIEDEMFSQMSFHVPDGAYQAVFGLDVLPEYRCQGIAGALMRRLIEVARARRRKGLILTCKEKLIPYYERFGYKNSGLSRSIHGGAVWYDMILEFEDFAV